MSGLISREAILKNIEKIRQGVQMMDDTRRASIIMNGMYLCEKAVMNQPSAQPERKTGQWERTGRKNVYGGYEVKCSVCGDTLMLSDISREHYCRNCGAKMEENDED